MKYTKSVDGKDRVTVNVSVRLTKEEYANFSRMARDTGANSLRVAMADGVWDMLHYSLPSRHEDAVRYDDVKPIVWATTDKEEK